MAPVSILPCVTYTLYKLKAMSLAFNVYVQKEVIVNHFMEVCPLI